jgi:hypothetical protein
MIMKKLMTLMVLVVCACTSQAAVTIYTSDVEEQQVTSISGYKTAGHNMVGMTVTANSTDTRIWGEISPGSYGVAGSGWSLTEQNDTYRSDWSLISSTGLNRLVVDAGAGGAVFDIINGSAYTDGSRQGRPFTLEEISSTYLGNIDVTYSAPVSLAGDSFQGDLYRSMLIEFSNEFIGTLKFRTDTDNAQFSGGDPPTVPAPGALLLAAIGSSAAGFLRRRQWV